MRSAAVNLRLRTFEKMRATATPADLLALIPQTFTRDDDALVRGVLQELQRRPLDGPPPNSETLDRVVDYALRNRIEPLGGIDSVASLPGAASDVTRARLALHGGNAQQAGSIEVSSTIVDPAAWADYFDERAAFARKSGDALLAQASAERAQSGHAARQRWRNVCDDDTLCLRAATEVPAERERTLSIALAPEVPNGVPAYVEIYIDAARVAEGPLPAAQTFDAGSISPGPHPLEIRLVNPFTPQARQRRVRLPPAPL
jgi:hypothetical protein